MKTPSRRSLTVVGCTLIVAGMIAFLMLQKLDRADKWASVGAFILTLLGLCSSIIAATRGSRSNKATDQTGSDASGNVTVSKVDGPVLIGDHGHVKVKKTYFY